jgi:hypothetical protein
MVSLADRIDSIASRPPGEARPANARFEGEVADISEIPPDQFAPAHAQGEYSMLQGGYRRVAYRRTKFHQWSKGLSNG